MNQKVVDGDLSPLRVAAFDPAQGLWVWEDRLLALGSTLSLRDVTVGAKVVLPVRTVEHSHDQHLLTGVVVSAGSHGVLIECEPDECTSLVGECPHLGVGCSFFVLVPAA